MKSYKALFTASVLAAGLATAAQGQTVTHFTGSTAYRGQVHNAILHALTNPSYAYTGATLSSASQAIFTGTLNSQAVIIETSWSGSEAGIQTVAQDSTGVAVNYLPDNTTVSPSGISGVTAGTNSQIPDVAMSDTYQAVSQFNSSASIIISGTAHTYAALTGAGGYTDGVIGVGAFKWCASNGGAISSSGTISNITPQLVKGLFKNGTAPLSLATGNSSDSSINLIATGRNPDSGTRLTALAETGFGALGKVNQFQPKAGGSLVTGTGATIDTVVQWPVDTVNGIAIVKGNSGYSSGGQLAGALGSNTSAVGILVTYLSTGDAATAIGGGAKELTYNGVPYSLNNVQQGLYSFWGYEHMYYRSGSAVASVADSIATQLHDTDAAILVGGMSVGRSTDGATIQHN